ncbi:LlaJI restriction endonuclease [Chryseobacterium taichungense]|uniref:LlaJI restriction endonuclease n=1 Tax=Chryseobacterium taichungense TaxID=295069 RepID=A0A1H8A4S7_9FLAO|nr:LlaJI family restriction endonuclease [Chryseobacterium taichungense]SEM65700.1 LlaJI restriction endonuclease [Chryseobacterium taichungense]
MNNPVIYIEQKPYTKSELLISFSEEELFTLGLRGIIKQSNTYYKFTFVGVVSVRSVAFAVIPKIYTRELKESALLTIKTLKRYTKTNRDLFEGIDFFNIEPDNPECSELAIAEFLLEDFQSNGIYTYRDRLYEINGNGDIHWVHTVNDLDPIYSSGQPIYTDTINHTIIEDTFNLTAAIQKWGLNYISEKYSVFLGIDLIDFDFDYEEDLSEIGNPEQLINHLLNLLQTVYTDREIYLVKSLIFLIRSKTGALESDMSLYGTKAYSTIWEDICKQIWKYKHSKDSYFPRPKWDILGNNYESKSILLPDIIINDNENNTYLFDAKYYSLKFKSSLSGEPGYKDILKQFQYQQHIENKIEKAIGNFFLFPANEDEFSELKEDEHAVIINNIILIGNIKYELYPGKKILIILCPFKDWQQMYLENKSLEVTNLKDLIS